MSYQDFRNMPVWQNTFKLLIKIYKLTQSFPGEEKFGMISDMRRAANSVVHKIAEGFGRFEPKDKTRFYKISRGSSYELISQLLASFELNFFKNKAELDDLVISYERIIQELNSIIKTLEARNA